MSVLLKKGKFSAHFLVSSHQHSWRTVLLVAMAKTTHLKGDNVCFLVFFIYERQASSYASSSTLCTGQSVDRSHRVLNQPSFETCELVVSHHPFRWPRVHLHPARILCSISGLLLPKVNDTGTAGSRRFNSLLNLHSPAKELQTFTSQTSRFFQNILISGYWKIHKWKPKNIEKIG